jgi:predicted MFS family arabinose efflux permease
MPRVRFSGWLMWALASLFYAYQYILRVLPNILMNPIIEKFQIDNSIFGQISGIYYIGYAGMHIPIGILLDRMGPKIIMPLCVLLTTLGLLPLVYTDIWLFPAIGRGLIGVGSSGAILGVFKVIRMAFPERKFTRMLGVSVTIGLLGAIYGGQPVNYMLQTLGWEAVIQALCIMGIALSIFMYFVLPRYNQGDDFKGDVWHDVLSVLSNKKVISICLLGGFMVGPLEGFADVWGTEFFKLVYDFDSNLSSSLPSLIFFGMCFGSPFLSYIADRSRAYYATIVASGFGMLVAMLLILLGHLSSTYFLSFLLFFIGILCAYQIPLIYKASTYVKEKRIGLTTASANMIIMIFGYVFHGSIGRIMDWFWKGKIENGIHLYSPETYTKGLMIIPVGLLIGSLGLLIFKYKFKEK